jgi:hypothetical protein
MLQNELNQPVAQAADAVIKDHRIGDGSRHIAWLSCYAISAALEKAARAECLESSQGSACQLASRTHTLRSGYSGKSARAFRSALHLRHVVFDVCFFQQVDAGPLLASHRAAELGNEEFGLQRFGKSPARLQSPFSC